MEPRPVSFDPESPSFAADPYSVYDEMRKAPKATYFESMNIWLIPWYTEVDAIARDSRMWRGADRLFSETSRHEERINNNWHDMPFHERFVQVNLLEQDGEHHRKLRLVVMKAFTQTEVARHREMIEQLVNRLLEPLLEQDDIDFIEAFAAPIPGQVISALLGLPQEDAAQLRVWVEDMVRFFDVDRSDAKKHAAETATASLCNYLTDEIKSRGDALGDDLLSVLIRAERTREITETELIATALLILAAGHGSTIDVIGTGMANLLSHSDQWQALKNDQALIPSAIQEMFRFETPLPFFHRYVSEPIEIRGQSFKQGDKIGLLYGSANRDPTFVEHPARFDIRRPKPRHLAFGRGAHLCLGNHLARLSMEVIFRKLIEKTKDIQLAEDTLHYRPGLSTRGLAKLPLAISG